MAYTVDRIDVWTGALKDRPGNLAEKLAGLSGSGASLEFLFARRAPDKPGTGVVFLAPLKGAGQIAAAKKAGLKKAKDLTSVRVVGPDKAGLGASMTAALADAKINLRGLSAMAIGRNCMTYFAFDSSKDATKAGQILRKLLKVK